MKHFRIHLLILLFLVTFTTSRSQVVQWARKGISPGFEYGNAITTDDSGNVYVAGQLEYSTVFDGGFTLSSHGVHDILAGKYDADGNAKWIRHAGGRGGDVGYGVGVDASHNTYVSGEIEDTAIIGSGVSLISAGDNDIVLIKYSSGGSILWAKRWGNTGSDKSTAMAVSPSGDCYLTGYFSDDVYFGNTHLSTSGGYDIFILKVNSNGDVVWAKKAGGDHSDRGFGITYDKSGNVYITGIFKGDARFGGTTISNNGDVNSAFVAKYNSNGSFQWVKKGGDCCNTTEANCIAIDENDNVYTAGFFSIAADFGSNHLTSADSAEIFITKYNSSGNLIWAQSAGGPYEDIAFGLSVDTINHFLYATGQVDDHAYFGTHYAGAAGNRDIFIAAYDLSGNSLWAKCYGSHHRDIGYAISSDRNGSIFTTGVFRDTAYFGSYSLIGYPVTDFYVDKVSPAPAPSPSLQSSNVSLASVNCSDLELNFTPGNGNHRLIVVHENSAVSNSPVDGTIYSANPVFGSGSNLGNNNYVVYDGNGNSVIVSGLTGGQTYHFAIYEYNGEGAFRNYLTSSPARGNAQSFLFAVNAQASDNTICNGDSVVLQSSPAVIYSWSPSVDLLSNTGQAVIAFPQATTTFTVKCESNGCQAQSSVTVTVNADPEVTFTLNDSVCLNANSVTLTGGLPAGGWYAGAGVNVDQFNPSVAGIGLSEINYEFVDTNGCSGIAQSTIFVLSPPVVSATPIPDVCANDSPVNLNNGIPSGGIYTGAGVSTGHFDPSIGSGNYTLSYIYTDNLGCSNKSDFNITVKPLPAVNLGRDTTVCGARSIVINGGAGFNSYHWSTGATTQSVSIDSTGIGLGTLNLVLEAGNSSGCYNSDTILVHFDLCAGISTVDASIMPVEIFPNPFSDHFSVYTDEFISINIYDALGRLLETLIDRTGNISVGEDLSEGAYFVEVRMNDRKSVYKILKVN